jgi:hypothetical protein
MSDADYIVIRPAADLPPGFLSEHFNGRWIDRAHMPQASSTEASQDTAIQYGGMVAVPTGRFETRDYDDAVAEIYEVRP